MSEPIAMKPRVSWLDWARRHRAWLLVGLVLLFVVFVRVRLRDIPLERDEGEYAYAGQLLLQGVPPYKEAYNMKLPGTYAAYAAIMAVFGQTPAGIHMGLLLVNVASILLVFLLGRRLLDEATGVVAAAVFGLLSLSPTVFGLAAHATHFVTLFALMGVLVLMRALEGRTSNIQRPTSNVEVERTDRGTTRKLFVSGLMFGLAFVMKQHGIFFAVFGVGFLLWARVSVFLIRRQEVLYPWRTKGRPRVQVAQAVRPSIIRSHQTAAIAATSAATQGTGSGGFENASLGQDLSVAEGENENIDPPSIMPPSESNAAGKNACATGLKPFRPSARVIPEIPKRERLPPFPWRNTGKELACLVAGIALPYVVTCVLLWVAGVFPQFRFWTITYAAQYATEQSFSDGLALLRSIVASLISPNLGLWALALAGGLLMWWEDRMARGNRVLLLLLLLCSLASVSLGFYFRRHYFIPLLSVVALLSGVAVSRSLYLIRSDKSIEVLFSIPLLALFGIGMGAVVLGASSVWFAPSAEEAGRQIYQTSLFSEARKAGEYLRAHTQPGARIAVIGSEPEIYFYAHRRSATGYIYTYPLMERQSFASKMQKEMCDEVERAKPEYAVWVNHALSWAANPDSDKDIFDWLQSYWKSHLNLEQTFAIEDIAQSAEANGESTVGDSGSAGVRLNEASFLLVLRQKGT